MDNKHNSQPDYDLLVQQVKALGEEENYWLPVLANTWPVSASRCVPACAARRRCRTKCNGWTTCISSPGILPATATAMRKS